MDPRPIFDTTTRQEVSDGALARATPSPDPWPGTHAAELPSGNVRFPGEDGGKSLSEMAQRDLVATLQLLAERAQYITGASGAAIALRDGDRMVCRASAGTSAPEVGAHLQVNSGLSGESVRTKQTLRCDDAATDTRVNRESCEALGIASVVVMPLVQGDEVIGVFELFSDKAHAFEPRDITALERMGGMVFIALEQAAIALSKETGAPAAGFKEPPTIVSIPAVPVTHTSGSEGVAFHLSGPIANPPEVLAASASQQESKADPEDILDIVDQTTPDAAIREFQLAPALEPRELPVTPDHDAEDRPAKNLLATSTADDINAQPPPLPASASAVASLRKCEKCGFPVSEGRKFCLDCEKKRSHDEGAAATTPDQVGRSALETAPPVSAATGPDQSDVPFFLDEKEQDPSWLASHKYMIGAIAVAVAGIVVVLFVR
jgi:putative methionine-R-sulfoxide reductase with GAF domain